MKIGLEEGKIKINATQLKNFLYLEFAALLAGEPLPPLLIWGDSGVGKTTIVKNFALELKNKNKDVEFYEYRLGTKTSANVLGLHFVDTNEQKTVRFLNVILKEIVKRTAEGKYSILFLDEFSLGWDASNGILDALNYKEKTLDGHPFDKVLIVAAGNYIKEFVNRFNPAVWTRFTRVNYEPTPAEVAQYIVEQTGCYHVATYLELFPSDLIVKDNVYYKITPRDWETIAKLCCKNHRIVNELKTLGYDENTIRDIIKTEILSINENIGHSFWEIRDEINSLPKIEQIVASPEKYLSRDYKIELYLLYRFMAAPEMLLGNGFLSIFEHYARAAQEGHKNHIGVALARAAKKVLTNLAISTSKTSGKTLSRGDLNKILKYIAQILDEQNEKQPVAK
jgi:GTPase SAR1 family protein